MALLLKFTDPVPNGLKMCSSVLEIGPGIRPCSWYKPKEYVCVEPYRGYARPLIRAGFNVIQDTALNVLSAGHTADAIWLIHVIEHMERDEGEQVLKLAKAAARKQVVVATPTGFHEQNSDRWQLGGDYWQTHRSGWLPEDFEGWDIVMGKEDFCAMFDK